MKLRIGITRAVETLHFNLHALQKKESEEAPNSPRYCFLPHRVIPAEVVNVIDYCMP